MIEQAHHWYAAHDTARALESAWQAAAAAGQALAYAEKLAMLARILELCDTLPDAARRIGASHLTVLESAVEAALSAGETERGIGFATAALEQIDAAREPARAALMLKARARMKRRLGHGEGIDDLREALRLVPADSPGGPWTGARLAGRMAGRIGTTRRPRRRRGGAAGLPAGGRWRDGGARADHARRAEFARAR